MNIEFTPFPKMGRLYRDVIVTEKLDGTNAQLLIEDASLADGQQVAVVDGLAIWAGSRNRWLDTSSKGDNFGFAKWAADNAEDLVKLGTGRHYGEWWGVGIQRGYDQENKKFSLFNARRWKTMASEAVGYETAPACCGVVPILYEGLFNEQAIKEVLQSLRNSGSRAAPGFMNPEGIITYHIAAGVGFKTTLHDDHKPKGN